MTKENQEISAQANHSWEVKGRVLVISDVHQNIEWAKAIIEKEVGNYDHIVFLGDFFDSFFGPPIVAGIKETTNFVKEIFDQKYGPTTVLLGNHDIIYAEAWFDTSKYRNPKRLNHYCSGYTNSKAHEINKILDWQDWKKFKLFTVANGWLLSHAGFRANNFMPFQSLEDNFDGIESEYNKEFDFIHFQPRGGLFRVGQGRGGDAEWGGPLWCDWHREFEDELPIKQLVGHSYIGKCRAVKIGNSYCIDAAQTTYAIIAPNGEIEFRAITKSAEAGWLFTEVEKATLPTRKELEERYKKRMMEQNIPKDIPPILL